MTESRGQISAEYLLVAGVLIFVLMFSAIFIASEQELNIAMLYRTKRLYPSLLIYWRSVSIQHLQQINCTIPYFHPIMFSQQLMLNGFRYIVNNMSRYEKGKKVIEDIQQRSVEEIFGELEDIAPDLSRFVIEFPYSEIYTRDEVDLKTREICTVAALTVLGTVPQLKDHINAALNVGNSPTEIVEIIMQMCAYCGFPKAINGVVAAKEVFTERGLLPVRD